MNQAEIACADLPTIEKRITEISESRADLPELARLVERKVALEEKAKSQALKDSLAADQAKQQEKRSAFAKLRARFGGGL
jgi:hypothetical protein